MEPELKKVSKGCALQGLSSTQVLVIPPKALIRAFRKPSIRKPEIILWDGRRVLKISPSAEPWWLS